MHEHDGFYFRGALGYAHLSQDLESNAPAPLDSLKLSGGGAVLSLWFGGTPARGLVLGGALLSHAFVDPDVTFSGGTSTMRNGSIAVSSVGPFLQYYFNPTSGFHLQGFVGYTSTKLTSTDNGKKVESTPGTGAGFALGAGYDFWISEQWSLGVEGRFFYAALSDTTDTATDPLAAGSGGTPSTVTEDHTLLLPTLCMTATYH